MTSSTATEPMLIPRALVTALLSVALRTEVGQALIAGYRCGNAELLDQTGTIELEAVAGATIRINATRAPQ